VRVGKVICKVADGYKPNNCKKTQINRECKR